jgi:phage terminase small subunit
MADPKALPPVPMTDNVQIESRRRRRGQQRRGEPNKLTMSIEPVDGTEWGPAMRALPSDRHRAFVLALYQIKPGYGAHVKAAKMAGFGTSTSSPKSWSVIASNLAHDEKIQAALHEEDQKRIRAVAPRAVQALERLIEDPKHKDHARAIGMTLERVHPSETYHTVRVERDETDHDAEAVRHLRFFKALGVRREKLEELFGYSGLSRVERMLEEADAKAPAHPRPPVIDGEATEL